MDVVTLVNLNLEEDDKGRRSPSKLGGKCGRFDDIGDEEVDIENLENPQLLAKINEELIEVDKKLKIIEHLRENRENERESEENKLRPESKEELEELQTRISNLKSSIMTLPSFKYLSQPNLCDILKSYIFKFNDSPTPLPQLFKENQNTAQTGDLAEQKIVEEAQINEAEVDEETWKERYKQLEVRCQQLEAENRVLRLENSSLHASRSLIKEEKLPLFSP